MNLMFGDCYRRLSQSENSGPDLAGIRQMLDLVSAFEHIIYRFIYFILGGKQQLIQKIYTTTNSYIQLIIGSH